jgi:DNA repair protein RecO (recombination protein O)
VDRARLYRTEAIVLKRHDFGEADRILTLYTPDRGKVSAIAKGVRRIASRKGGHVELFTHAAVLLAEGRNLHVLTQAETIESYRAVREDLERTTYACYMAETVDRFTGEDLGQRPTFELLRDSLAALSDAEDPALVARYFEMRLLGQLGYRPQLFYCATCDAGLDPDGNAFSPEAGGAVCPRCAANEGGAIALDPGAFRVLRFLQTRDWDLVRQVRVSPVTRAALERLMHAYVRHLLERDLASVKFLQSLRRVAPQPRAAASRPVGDTGPGA